ncbi:MAG: histidinol-phosphatase [Pseudomonadota bacterium]
MASTTDLSYDNVSVHGGHSGTYCGHAKDTLREVVQAYADNNFAWVCLTEHMPTQNKLLIPPEETQQGFQPDQLQARFDAYFKEARQLQDEYQDRLDILVGFETEAYTGYEQEVADLIRQHQPDMIVGSVHHLRDILFDGGPEYYARTVEACGSIEAMYCEYFDRQLELINRFEPAVVGHFDLIRIHDPEYVDRWAVPAIRERCIRNLNRIKELDLILDLNVRSLHKGAPEPYISAPWLAYAIEHDIHIAPGDDSHGVASVAAYMDQAVSTLVAAGGHTNWPRPALARHVTR